MDLIINSNSMHVPGQQKVELESDSINGIVSLLNL